MITYIGPTGSGFGFRLAGMTVVECADNADLLIQLDAMTANDRGVVYVDEGLAETVLADIERIGERPGVTIVLLANSAHPKRLAAHHLENLIVQAVGSDIF